MRKEFFEEFFAGTEDDEIEIVKDFAPWAEVVVRVDGGWIAFESVKEYEIWKSQV
jgi:hypothetical protein